MVALGISILGSRSLLMITYPPKCQGREVFNGDIRQREVGCSWYLKLAGNRPHDVMWSFGGLLGVLVRQDLQIVCTCGN